jgi:hypothetical protein
MLPTSTHLHQMNPHESLDPLLMQGRARRSWSPKQGAAMTCNRSPCEALQSIDVENGALVITLTTGGARVGFHPGMDVPTLAQQLRILIHQLECKSPQMAMSRNVNRQTSVIVK